MPLNFLGLFLAIFFICVGTGLQAQERLCPDGKRSYFGVCPDDGNNSRPLPAPEPQPLPVPVPRPVPAPSANLPSGENLNLPWAVVYIHTYKGSHISNWTHAGYGGQKVVEAEGLKRCIKGWRTCEVWISGPNKCAAVLTFENENKLYGTYIPIIYDTDAELTSKIAACEYKHKGYKCFIPRIWQDNPKLERFCVN